VLDLNAVIEDAARMLRRVVGEPVDVTLRLEPGLDAVRADPAQITQVLMNLAANARDAMPSGGSLAIETRNVVLDEAYTATHLSVVPGRYVQLAVADTGIGMPPEVQEHLFEPFFTTKEVGKGTGLGLAGVHGIVSSCGGNIWVYSEVGRGTTFKIHLPAVDAGAEPQAKDTPVRTAAAPATVLLVEDNAPLLELAARILRRGGYEVLPAGSATEARRIASEHPGHIHLLLADVVMPGEGGPALARELTQGRPDMRVMHMSGYTDDAVVRRGIVNSEVVFVEKPFTPERLLQKASEALARPAARPRGKGASASAASPE
jgi:CheY-like chemotaxis protein